MLRDDKEWDPSMMIQVTESFGKMNPNLKEALQTMKPKENSDQRKSRLRKKLVPRRIQPRKAPLLSVLTKPETKQPSEKASAKTSSKRSSDKPTTQVDGKAKRRTSTTKSTQTNPKTRRARKLVSWADARHRRNE